MHHLAYTATATIAACGTNIRSRTTDPEARVAASRDEVDCPRCRSYLPRVRTVSIEDLEYRIAASLDREDGRDNPGAAECRAYDREDWRAKIARIKAGAVVREEFRSGRWQDAD